jgi:hypothetical protein
MSFRQLTIQAGERIHQIRVNRQDCHGPMQVVQRHLDITDRPEHGAQPVQLIRQMFVPANLETTLRTSSGCSAVAARPPRIRWTASGLSMRAPGSCVCSSSIWAHR